ncbi:MAG: GDSL-type esterase/lipase family protein [Paenibacillaceae bacterium]
MRSSGFIWRTVGIAAVLSTLLLVFGLVYAVNDVVNPTATLFEDVTKLPNPLQDEKEDNRINIVSLGDSMTKGTGDLTGVGYVGYLREKLAEVTGKPVFVLNNLGVNGYRTEQLLADLNDKPSVAETLKKADIIVFTIGGNDLFKYVREELDITSANIDPEELFKSIPEPAERLQQILKRLNEINPKATIVYMGLFNPFLDLDETRATSLAIAKWNETAFEFIHTYPNMILVPTADLFQKNLMNYLYTDHFHPNQEGYQRMADRAVQALY